MRAGLLSLLLVAACTPFSEGSSPELADGGVGAEGGVSGDGGTEANDHQTQVVIGCAETKGNSPPDPTIFTHVCMLRDGAVKCWGNSQFGQTGDDTLATAHYVEIAAGFDHTCARTKDGQVWCWGYNFHGQLGSMDGFGMLTANAAARKAEVAMATQITAGYGHSCGVNAQTGEVGCWGKRNDGEFGDNQKTADNGPGQTLLSVADVVQVAAGEKNTVVLDTGGIVRATGWDGIAFQRSFNQVVLPERATRVAAGKGSGCAILADGRLLCWGIEATFSSRTTVNQTPAQFGAPYKDVAMSRHTCAVRTDNKTVDCAGTEGSGQLGVGGSTLIDEGVTSVAVGCATTCVTTNAGNLLCWGNVSFLGVSPAVSPTPVKIPLPP